MVLTYGIPPEFRDGVHLFIYNRHTPSGQSRVYRVTQLRTDGVHCRESADTGPVNLKVVPNGYIIQCIYRQRHHAFIFWLSPSTYQFSTSFVVEVAALRSIVLRYAGAAIATRVFFVFFSEYVIVSFRIMVFFYLVTTGCFFYFSLLCENSINQSIMPLPKPKVYYIQRIYSPRCHSLDAVQSSL